MPKLNIDGIEIGLSKFDCENKVVILTIPAVTSGDRLKTIKQVSNEIKQTCGARAVITIPKYMNFNIRDANKTIHILDRIIKKLTIYKNKLEKMEENKKNAKSKNKHRD